LRLLGKKENIFYPFHRKEKGTLMIKARGISGSRKKKESDKPLGIEKNPCD